MNLGTTTIASTGAAAVALSGLLVASLGTSAIGHAAADSAVGTHPSPSHFTHGRVDNPWFPLKAGTRWVYRGKEEGHGSRDVMIATYRTRVIDGVVCRVVLDRVFIRGHLRERTHDYYAQTKRGTVWYFGEDSAEYNRHGRLVSRADSWRSGRDGAEAGIFMTAHPHRGRVYAQENYPGHAEDRFSVLQRRAAVKDPLIATRHALETREFTPLEPGVVEHKFYVRDVGDVHDVTVKGGTDHAHLVSLTHRPRR
jgi:hypothetical protein